MNDKNIDILNSISSGSFDITFHALERMKEREILKIDIIAVADSCTSFVLQEHNTWKIEGLDSRGEELTVIAAKEQGVLIVTVF